MRRDLMYLDLPGFEDETNTDAMLSEMQADPSSRARRMAAKLSGRTSQPHRSQTVKSRNIDDRISLLEWEIQQGKRDANIRRIAGQVLRKAGVQARDWWGEATALFEYTRKAIRYTRDPAGVELFQSPARSVDHGIGDCDDQVIFLASVLQSVGFPVKLRVIGLKGSDQFQHIYLLVGLPPHNPTEFRPLDPSRPEKAGWELPENQRGLLRDYEVED